MKKLKRFHAGGWLKSPRFRYGGLSAAVLIAALSALVALNLLTDRLERQNGWRVDCSFNAITTQSQATLDVLDALDKPVHIYAFYDKGDEDAPLLELLNRYAVASDNVTWEQTSLSLNPALVQLFSNAQTGEEVSANSIVVYCETTGRYRVLNGMDFASFSFDGTTGGYQVAGLNYEGRITSAIHYVTRDQVPRALFLQGHGEPNDEETVYLADLLYTNNYDVYYFSLDTDQITLEKDDLLLILSPQRDMTGDEMVVLQNHIRQGGSILFTCDYGDPMERMPNYRALLRSYGFLPKEGIVMAAEKETATYYGGNRYYLRPSMQVTDITMELVADNATSLILPGCRAFAIPEESDVNLLCEPMLLSGTGSRLDPLSDTQSASEQETEKGPFALALQASRMSEEGIISRACVLGCSEVLINSDLYAMTVSQEFTMRIAEYLLNMDSVDLNIMAKAAIRPMLGPDAAGPGSLILVFLPMSVVAAAVVILAPRRRM